MGRKRANSGSLLLCVEHLKLHAMHAREKTAGDIERFAQGSRLLVPHAGRGGNSAQLRRVQQLMDAS